MPPWLVKLIGSGAVASLLVAVLQWAWAFVAIWIGCVVFTAFAAVAVWLVSKNELYTLILGLAAHVQLFVGMGAFAFVLGRRMMLKADREGIEFDDRGHPDAKP